MLRLLTDKNRRNKIMTFETDPGPINAAIYNFITIAQKLSLGK